jgi:hypothetical protein
MLLQAERYPYFLMEAVRWWPILTLVAYDRKSIRDSPILPMAGGDNE